MRSPVFSRADQAKAMDAILDRMNVQDLTRRFIGLVASKRRLFVLPAMISIFNALLAQLRGEVRRGSLRPIRWTSAQLDAIAAALKQTAAPRCAACRRMWTILSGRADCAHGQPHDRQFAAHQTE